MTLRIVQREAVVPYTPEQMYELVFDVEAYPQFLPWCSGAQLRSRDDKEQVAGLTIGLNSLNSSFLTRNELDPPASMTMHLLDGPFSRLEGRWTFTPLGDDGCDVALKVEFQFSSMMQDIMFGAAFQTICNELIDAFVQRAHDLYG